MVTGRRMLLLQALVQKTLNHNPIPGAILKQDMFVFEEDPRIMIVPFIVGHASAAS
jgi:hypothetical protein